LLLVLFSGFFALASGDEAAPMGLDPLGALGEELHFLALVFFLPLHHLLNLLGLAPLLLSVVPLFLQLLQLVSTLFVLLVLIS